jgi:acyl transferase domain-containing protein/3-hydroxymyristoyl/3-hydroxydecanoyl-(acyl carrier protein) dehydratase
VAIVGMAGLLPGAGDLDAFWRNVKAAADCSSEPPPGRWPIEPKKLLDPKLAAPDRVPTLRGYYLPSFTSDLGEMDLAGWPLDRLDTVFHLALHIGNAAWQSAVTAPVNRDRCGVIFGNIALPTEKMNAITMDVLGSKVGLHRLDRKTNRLNRYSTGLPAGLVARGLGFGLGGYALDAACASSLYSIKLACDELLADRADAMLAGGLVRPDSMYTQMGFAQLRALSPSGRCAPFDARADGLVVGEGGCAFVLKRLSDAIAHGDTIHGVIAGIGLSNDIEGNVLQPASEGQLRALHAAYRQAGWQPADVHLIECHATGTPTGDAVEFESLRKLWSDQAGSAVLGGVKSTVGHLLTGAGAAAMAKVLLAMRERTLPPTANFEQPAPGLGYEKSPFRILQKPQSWDTKGPRRAAVNGFGFGGINAHVLIEEWDERSPIVDVRSANVGGPLPPPGRPTTAPERWRSERPQSIAIVGMASRTGSPIESITLPISRFRIPPKELEEMLPQQTLMLQVAADALVDCRSKPTDNVSTGVFVGVQLDPNTTNYHLRWLAGEIDPSLMDAVHPALTANRTMGSLASIAASRVARFAGAGGPSFAVCDEQAGGLRSVALAVEALRKGEIDRALVGEVAFNSDSRIGGATDGASAIVLRRLADAERDGDRVYMTVQDVRNLDEGPDGRGAFSGLANLVIGCSRFEASIGGSEDRRAFLIRDRADGAFQFIHDAMNPAGFGLTVTCVEAPGKYDRPCATTALAGRPDGLFMLTGDSTATLFAELGELRRIADGSPNRVARRWWQSHRSKLAGRLGLAFVAESLAELRQLIDLAESRLRERPGESIADRFFYSPNPLHGEVAFVYPGSGNHFSGMGRDLGVAFPHVLHRQMAENQYLASQYHAPEIWSGESLDHLSPRELIFAQVALGTLVSDLLASFGVKPNAVVPYSLGESAQLYGTRAWRDRDEMFHRMQKSPLFATDLAGPCNAARTKWQIRTDQPIEWKTGVIAASAERVRAAIPPDGRVYVQIINTSDDCVIGGERSAVDELVKGIGASFVEVRGVSTAHCEVAEPVRDRYRELHRLPTFPVPGVRYYSGAWGRAYELSEESAADAITAAVLDMIDFPRVVNAAYADGARIFVEIGPGASCSRMIDAILNGRSHLARAACVPRQDSEATILRLLANLHTEGVPVDLSILYDRAEQDETKPTGPTITLPVGYHPEKIEGLSSPPSGFASGGRTLAESGHINPTQPVSPPILPSPRNAGGRVLEETADQPIVSPVVLMAEVQTAALQAHEAFLRFSTALQTNFAETIAQQTELLRCGNGWHVASPVVPSVQPQIEIPRSLNFEQCMEFARGKVGNVLGPKYAEIDSFPTRVRLPEGPLQLVDRIVTIEGESLSLKPGRVITEHRVRDDRWYLDVGRIPACIAIEAGQADLFLSGFLGIDFKTRGLACYRLLDAAVTFHRELPKVGDLIRYDIRIDNFFRQGDTYLFRFRFEGTVNGEPLLTMRDGCAGFFTTEELAAGKGVVHTALDLKPMPGKKPDGWSPPVALRTESLSELKVDALRNGDLVAAFGSEFRPNLHSPMRLPGGMLNLVHRVERIEPTGGRYGLGRIRCEADIHPDDWFLTCHFVDDQVMPGTLMYECCLHTLRVLLMRMGWICEEGEARFEPVPGVASRLKCRGQVIATTRKVVYEVSIKEIEFRPEPFVICDALMYADGKPIVDIANLSLRLNGMTRERLDEIWQSKERLNIPAIGQNRGARSGSEGEYDSASPSLPLRALRDDAHRPTSTTLAGLTFTSEQVLEFATGSPSKAFGDRYRPFDRDRFIARLPGPPFSFIDRVVRVENCEAWKLAPGALADVEYDVPAEAWYFAANRCDRMPYVILNEIALQACGWMAAYLGSSLTSPEDLHFRNLGGNAAQHAAVGPDAGTLTTRIKLTRVSPAAGMIILAFDFEVSGRSGPVYSGDTTFGFFTKSALANQVGLKDAKFFISNDNTAGASPVSIEPPFPDAMLRMVDSIAWMSDTGGPKGLGVIEGRARVNPDAWFFKAHFFQDPVWPGSLGLESVVQLMKVFAHRRWGSPTNCWQAMVPNERHRWTYRGQIVPTASEVTVQAYITEIDDSRRFLRADGLLGVDGRIIYSITDFTLEG